MNLNENIYETAALYKLPPNIRDLAEDLLGNYSLGDLINKLDQPEDTKLLTRYKVQPNQWQKAFNAALLAKTTYFHPNPKFSEAELLYLIKAGCLASGYPLSTYTLNEALELTQKEYPVFNQWLKSFSSLLIHKHAAH